MRYTRQSFEVPELILFCLFRVKGRFSRALRKQKQFFFQNLQPSPALKELVECDAGVQFPDVEEQALIAGSLLHVSDF
eukprot:m.30782 g.30782  ORF g.30782 m.30782 type:complete len:78 (+) comp16342_c1_seq1:634-867(+)